MSICRKIVIFTAVMFFVQVVSSSRLHESPITEWCAFSVDEAVYQFQVWRFLTYGFLHDTGGIWHLVMNMICLWSFGPDIESIYGSREFLRFYLVTIVCGAIANIVISKALGMPHPMIGASAGVMGVMALFAWHFPRRTVCFMGLLTVQIRWLVALYVLSDLYPILRALGDMGTGSGIAHAAHLGGFAYGIAYGKMNLRSRLWATVDGWFNWGQRAKKSRQRETIRTGKLRVHHPEPEVPETPTREDDKDFSNRVDEVLRKISEQGESSLTAAERQLLVEAATRFKRRQSSGDS